MHQLVAICCHICLVFYLRYTHPRFFTGHFDPRPSTRRRIEASMRILMDLHGKFAKQKQQGSLRKCGRKFAPKKVSESFESSVNWNCFMNFRHHQHCCPWQTWMDLFIYPIWSCWWSMKSIMILCKVGGKLQCQLAADWMVDMIPLKWTSFSLNYHSNQIQQNSHSMLVSWMRWSLHCDNKNPAARSQSRMFSRWSG